MLKPLTTDNLSPTLRYLRWNLYYSDNNYRVFPPNWGWFTRAHYLVLRKFRSRSLNDYLQMTWFPLQWVAQNIRRFDLVNSILPNIYFLEIALNASAAPFLNSYVNCRVNVERWAFEVVSCNPMLPFLLCTRLSYSWWTHDRSHERAWDISTSHGHRNQRRGKQALNFAPKNWALGPHLPCKNHWTVWKHCRARIHFSVSFLP